MKDPQNPRKMCKGKLFPPKKLFFLGGGEHAKSQMLNQHMPAFLEGVALGFVQFFLWNVDHCIMCRESM